jgi:DNA-binding SARP family transcriptional activator/TolB-like protein
MLRLTTLGALDLRDGLGHPVREVLAQPKRLALLTYLALEGRHGPVSRDRLLAMFWPESDDAKARNTLSQALHHLRQALGPELLESQGANAIVVNGDALWCDATVFLDALGHGEVELALDLYRGEFCPTLFVSGAPEAEEWLGARRRELRRQALGAARALAEQKAAAGDAAGAARAARRALAMQPDDEGDVRAMLALLDRLGDAAGALTAYQEFARRQAAELELEPAPETAQLADAIRRRREQSATALGGAATAFVEPGPVGMAGSGSAVASRTERWLGRHTAIAAVLLALVAIIGTSLLRPGATAPHAAAETTVAVFPFTVRGGPAFDYLRDGMVDLLSAKLEGVSGFHAMDPRSVVAAVIAQAPSGPLSAAFATQTARRLGAGWYINGDVVEVAGRLQIRGTLFDLRSGSPAATASVTGDTTALFELVDDLTGRLLVGFGSGRDTSLTRLASVTTHSLPALKAFLAGEQAMRAGRDAAAAEAFREAVMLDSTFALAEYRLALSATWVAVNSVPDNTTIISMAAAATRHARHLTPLVRDLLAAYTAYKEVHGDEAERIYRRLAESHPDNVEAWFMLGEVLFHYNGLRGRTPEESRPAFERVLALDPTNSHALLHLARLAARDGHDAQLDSLARVYLGRYQDAGRTIEIRTLLAGLHRDPAGRDEVVREARVADPIVLNSVLQAALVYSQDLELSRSLIPAYQHVAWDSFTVKFGAWMLTDLELAAGHWVRPAPDVLGTLLDGDWFFESRVLLAACRSVPMSRPRLVALRDSVAARRPYPSMGRPGSAPAPGLGEAMQPYLIGLLSARLGDTARVREQLAALAAVRGTAAAQFARTLTPTLRAELAYATGDPGRARLELERFDFGASFTLAPHGGVHERFLMAELLKVLGRNEEALDWYLSYPAGYDQPWAAPAHLRAAQIYQRLGNRERAIFHYTRFIRLWENADPEFQPLVTQAREALAQLSR